MIKAEELRIGNWVHHTEQWSTLQGYDSLDSFDFQFSQDNWYHIGECLLDLNILEPIPLTEEWLIRFGFENCLNGYWCNQEFLNVKIIDNQFYIYISGNDMDLNWNRKTKYVHSLQNLYFALTGQELELKEK